MASRVVSPSSSSSPFIGLCFSLDWLKAEVIHGRIATYFLFSIPEIGGIWIAEPLRGGRDGGRRRGARCGSPRNREAKTPYKAQENKSPTPKSRTTRAARTKPKANAPAPSAHAHDRARGKGTQLALSDCRPKSWKPAMLSWVIQMRRLIGQSTTSSRSV